MRKITIVFILAIVILIAAYDVFAIAKGGTEASISYVLIGWSKEFPAFTFTMGFTMGHLFWVIRKTPDAPKN